MNFQTVPVVLAFLAAQLMVSGITSINLDKMCANYSQEPHDKENEFLGEKQTSCVIIAEFCQNYTKVPGHCSYVNTHVTNMIPPDVCFPQTLGGGIAYTRCFKKLSGVHYNNSFNATRKCKSDGRWSRINFTACRPIPDSSDPAEDYVNAHLKIVVIITYVGRGLSLFTLIIAFLLFWRLRSIRCWRNIIHWNLATSLILQNVIWLIHSFFTSYQTRKNNEVWFQVLCRVLAAISIYSQVATYCWMFVEGVYLHMMVVMAYTYDRFSIKLYMVLGWGTPIPITVIWAVLKAVYEDKECWMQNPTDTWVEYFYQIPIFVLFAINALIMVNVVRILVTKLIKQNSLESAVTYSKAVKAAFFLFNLLGITYILFFLSPGDGAGEIAFFYVNAIFQSFQGFLVCLIYCLSNSEILNAIGRNWRKWRHNTKVPCFEKDLRGIG
ncbi:corticotropin-releasing factor receptor 2-like [Clavelina lepadiformis]|uniref:corticotropin-releasing factor receptor 2-like n=1 Tax=Clavelina lepadiformis TaxID=159417 RepID=UPI004041EB58